jgi:hypothetical protein
MCVCVALALASVFSLPARADVAGPAAGTATFAIIMGVNRAIDPGLKPLLYADDDAARYQMLFRSLGARTALLTRPDANTSRVLPAVVADARLPDRKGLSAAVAALASEVRAARARGLRTVFYFLYAGHGNVDGGRAYLALEDGRLTGDDLDRTVLLALGADQTHVIVDACYSFYLARERGPGGRSRMVQGFSDSVGGLDRPDVGLLLSTSSARESHEWDGFQAGVFSHEVRSGLYGAADIDGDGQIDYREIAAFIVRANAAIPNDRLRPDVFARPPQGQSRLFDLRPGAGRHLVVDPAIPAGHYLLEDRAGNRLLEFHGAPRQTIKLIRPEVETVFLRHVDSGREYQIDRGPGEVLVSALAAKPSPLRARGAAHHAFSLIFSLAFDEGAVAQYQFPAVDAVGADAAVAAVAVAPDVSAGRPVWRTRAALAATVVTGLAAAGSVAYVLSSRGLAEDAAKPTTTQQDAAALNQRIERNQERGMWLGIGAGATAAAALTLWLWPSSPVAPAVSRAAQGEALYGLRGQF